MVICILHCHTRVSIQYAALNGSILCIFYFPQEQNVTQNFMVFLGCNWADYQQWGLTGRITLYMRNDCLNPTSNNSTVHAVSRDIPQVGQNYNLRKCLFVSSNMPLSFWLHKKPCVLCRNQPFLHCCFSFSKLHTQHLSAVCRVEDAIVLRERHLSFKKKICSIVLLVLLLWIQVT